MSFLIDFESKEKYVFNELLYHIKYEDGPLHTKCWIFSGCLVDGYGQLRINNNRKFAHRYSYEYYVGPIPEGLHIDHLCRIRSCTNPDHLEAVTQLINNQRMFKALPRKTHCKYGHSLHDAFLKKDGARNCRSCGLIRNKNRTRRS